MALATRCPNCHTTFRVVQDQLKLYSGIVRCGVCQQVFNGADHLVNDETPAENAPSVSSSPAPEPDQKAPVAAESMPVSDKVSDSDESEELNDELRDMLAKVRSWDNSKDAARQQALSNVEQRAAAQHEQSEPISRESKADDEFAPTELKIEEYADLDALESQAAQEEQPVITLELEGSENAPTSVYHELELDLTLPAFDETKSDALKTKKPQPERDLQEWSDTESRSDADDLREPSLALPPDLPTYNQAAMDAYLVEPKTAEPEIVELTLDAPPPAAEPEFVKKAKKRKKSRLLTRILLSICSLLLLAALALQAIYAFHDKILTRLPAARPIVAKVCDYFGCETRIATRIDELSLESTELQNLPNRPNAFVLDVVLRNRSSSAQAWPHLELTLNDESGQPAVRRVLSPADYLGDTHDATDIEKGIAAESEKALKLAFTLDKAKAAGYRVYLFYP